MADREEQPHRPAEDSGPAYASHHMSADEFRRHGRAVVDWIADYLENVEAYPVLSPVPPGAVRAALPQQPPEHGEPFEAMLRDVGEIVLPGVTHWQSPGFFAYFPSNNSYPSILGELLSAGLGVQGMLWATSPACTEVETLVVDWLAQLLDLPAAFRFDGPGGGVIQDSASSATLCALLAARERATGSGAALGDLVAYTSTQAHSSVEKAVRVLGLRADQLRLVGVDDRFAMRADLLRDAVAADLANGRRPFAVVATVGTTSSLAVDPVREIGATAKEHGLWLHVDAAMAGVAAICPEWRWLHDGLDLADSYCTNPHKWLFTNFDCDGFWVADRRALTSALSVLPEYLRNQASESGAVVDYRDWQLPLGRRFRALKLWFVLRHYGAAGLRDHLRHHVALAGELAARVAEHPKLALAAPADLNLVCLRHLEGDPATQRLIDAVNRSGTAYVTHTRLADRLVLRVCVGQAGTQRRHVDALWRLLADAA